MLTALEADIGQTSLRDQRLLKKRLQGIVKIRDEKSRVAVLNAIKADVETAKQKFRTSCLIHLKSSIQKIFLLVRKNKLFMMR